ncbi:MAG: nicotinate phosphoribosyltransferase [Lewinella sp.]|nr:nicotinate phosphoribosyltransferase [Lewinella sp.]
MIPTSHLHKIYRGHYGTLTDLYQLTMAYGYWKHGLHRRQAVFHLFYRRAPYGQSFVTTAGLALAVDYLQHLRFSVEDIQYLGSLRGGDGKALFPETFLHYLQRFRFTGSVWAMPEGTAAFPFQPMLRIEAPLAEAQLVESALLNLLNFSSLIATKAGRMTAAAQGEPILEFGLRRAQGLDGALTASRSAFIGGCAGSSNVWAGRWLGIPVKGTHAHSWVMVFEEELSAFSRYAEALPNNCTLLVDTYDTFEGVQNAITVGRQLRQHGHELSGIRLDSGDLATLSEQARKLLDEAGFTDTVIVASNDLDEEKITQLKAAGAPIALWGVGTRLVTGHDQPALGGVYKLGALQNEVGHWEDRIKLSEQAIKITNPGRLQVRRYFENDQPVRDLLFHLDDEAHLPAGAHTLDLLQPIIREGELIYNFPSLTDIQSYARSQWETFTSRMDKPYLYGNDSHLERRKQHLIAAGATSQTP